MEVSEQEKSAFAAIQAILEKLSPESQVNVVFTTAKNYFQTEKDNDGQLIFYTDFYDSENEKSDLED